MPKPAQPVPADFPQQFMALTQRELCRHYRVACRTITRWTDQSGLTPRPIKRAAPKNWAELCAKYTKTEIHRVMKCHRSLPTRWAIETGIFPRAYEPPKTLPRKVEPKPRTPQNWRFNNPEFVNPSKTRRIIFASPKSGADLARNYLCSTGLRPSVFRCDERANADQKGEFWRIGNSCTPLTDQQLVRRALDKGMVL